MTSHRKYAPKLDGAILSYWSVTKQDWVKVTVWLLSDEQIADMPPQFRFEAKQLKETAEKLFNGSLALDGPLFVLNVSSPNEVTPCRFN